MKFMRGTNLLSGPDVEVPMRVPVKVPPGPFTVMVDDQQILAGTVSAGQIASGSDGDDCPAIQQPIGRAGHEECLMDRRSGGIGPWRPSSSGMLRTVTGAADKDRTALDDDLFSAETISSPDGVWHRPVARWLGVAVLTASTLAIALAVGRGSQPTLPGPTLRLSIEYLTGGADVTPGRHGATPRIDGYLIKQDVPRGWSVSSVTWGSLDNRVVDDGEPVVTVVLETRVDCRTVLAGDGQVGFPPLTATLVDAQGNTRRVPVLPVSTKRWGNVASSCADPTRPAETNQL